MQIRCHITDLFRRHPELRWNEAAIALAAVASRRNVFSEIVFSIEIARGASDLTSIDLTVELTKVSSSAVAAAKRTYDTSRLVEMAAVAIAGLTAYYGLGSELVEVSRRGSGADYLVSDGRLLEVAGRSRRRDLDSAWRSKIARLVSLGVGPFAVCVAEFEGLTARFGIFP
jgi:hypothetical protein